MSNRYTNEEVALIDSNPDLPARELARLTGRTTAAIRNWRRKAAIAGRVRPYTGGCGGYSTYTIAQDVAILSHDRSEEARLAAAFGRSRAAVYARRVVLRKQAVEPPRRELSATLVVRRPKHQYTPEEDELLMDPEYSSTTLALHLNVSLASITQRRRLIRVRTQALGGNVIERRPMRYWTPEEDAIALDLSLSNAEVGARCGGRSSESACIRRRFLRIKHARLNPSDE